jgi:hypothetical protein
MFGQFGLGEKGLGEVQAIGVVGYDTIEVSNPSSRLYFVQ